MIGIIGAMDQELKKFITYVDDKKEVIINNFEFIIGKVKSQDIVIVKARIGRVASSIATSILLEHFDIDYVVNLGSSGGVDQSLKIGDIIIGDRMFYGDVDITAFDYKYGQMAGCPPYFTSDSKLIERLISKNQNTSFITGSILTFDRFVTNKQFLDDIVMNYFKNDKIMVVEMEATAIAHTCLLYNKPLLIIKSVSDVVGSDGQSHDFYQYLEKISDKLAEILYNLF